MKTIQHLWALLFLLAAVSSSSATQDFVVSVPQPLVTNQGLVLSPVSFIQYASVKFAGEKVRLVAAESFVGAAGGEPSNLNAASLIGAEVAFTGMHGDTLKVVLDLSSIGESMESPSGLRGVSVSDAVQGTVDCLLIAAWEDRMGMDWAQTGFGEARFVELEVVGSEAHKARGGVFSGTELEQLSVDRGF